MTNIIEELYEEAQELIDYGNSKEQHEGYGMKNVLNKISKYYYGFKEYDKYFDSISDEEQPKLNKKLKILKIY